MNATFGIVFLVLLCLLALTAYIDRIYFEMGKFLSREYTENIDVWERRVEPKLKLAPESAALSASVLRQLLLLAIAFLLAIRLRVVEARSTSTIATAVFELLLVLVIFDRLIPQIFFTRTRGEWVIRIRWVVQALFYLALPITLTLSLVLSIAALAEEEEEEDEHPSEAVDALLEAGEEEGVLDEEDRELVRLVVEFGDKIVREVMTPRPEIFAVPSRMSLEEFTTAVNEHGFSRVPVYVESLDKISGVAFARDLLKVQDEDAKRRTVASLQKPVAFVPETKKVNELLREMQSKKQHLGIVIDEYGGVAGLVTIEDLLEAIVGNIEDEHDTAEDDAPVKEEDGSWVLPGSFDVSRLRELFMEEKETEDDGEYGDDEDGADMAPEAEIAEQSLTPLLAEYDATTVGGLVSEMAGHIPLPGEVVEDGPLRIEVMESTDRLIEKVRVKLTRGEVE
ncbi:hemolysin family protein [Granulicella cerasi]|uniref:Hemolysin family protein n=1 Tax=Granulicella cerasi TaxID=741063 RepID=A0ABW1ZGS7_9BACT|nr:hemolysin family protein [Granulicella cerasi]